MEAEMSRNAACAVIASLALGAAWACENKSSVAPTPTPAACTFVLSTMSLSFNADGGDASVAVTTASHCTWTAVSDHGWMAVTAGASVTGSGTVSIALATNTSTESRTGVLTIAGQQVAVHQEGALPVCAVTISPTSAVFTKDAATGAFIVTAQPSCRWTAVTDDGWLTITSSGSGSGTATVSYAVARNTSTDARTGSIHIADTVFSVLQQGDMPACEFHVAPVQINACMAVPYELVTTVTTQPTCGWTATSDTPWVTVSGTASRSGSGEIRFRVGDNYDAPRQGVLKVRWDTPTAGQNVQVSQAGCRYGVSTTSISVPADGGSFSFDVYQQSDPIECGGPLQNGCRWSATADAGWITITSAMPRIGDDRVRFTAAATPGIARIGTISVRDKSVIVAQSGR